MVGDGKEVIIVRLLSLKISLALSSLLIQIFWIFKTLANCHLLQVAPSQNYSLFLIDSKYTPSISSDSLHSSVFPQDGKNTPGSSLYHILTTFRGVLNMAHAWGFKI